LSILDFDFKYNERYLHHTAMHDIPQFGSKVDPMPYLAWDKRIEKLHPFIIRSSDEAALSRYSPENLLNRCSTDWNSRYARKMQWNTQVMVFNSQISLVFYWFGATRRGKNLI